MWPVANKVVSIMSCLKYEVFDKESDQWTACSFDLNRLVSPASLCDIVELPAGSHKLAVATCTGLKFFVHQQTFASTLFRPIPIFHIKLVRTIAALPEKQYGIYWHAFEQHTGTLRMLHLLMPERSTFKKLMGAIRNKTVDEDILHEKSTNPGKFMFVFDDALVKNARRMALPLLLQGVGLRKDKGSSDSKSSMKDVKLVRKATRQR